MVVVVFENIPGEEKANGAELYQECSSNRHPPSESAFRCMFLVKGRGIPYVVIFGLFAAIFRIMKLHGFGRITILFVDKFRSLCYWRDNGYSSLLGPRWSKLGQPGSAVLNLLSAFLPESSLARREDASRKLFRRQPRELKNRCWSGMGSFWRRRQSWARGLIDPCNSMPSFQLRGMWPNWRAGRNDWGTGT